MKNQILFKNAKIWTDNGILFCQIKNETSNRKLNKETVDKYIHAATKLCHGIPMPFLIDLRSAQGTFLVSAAKLLATSSKLKAVRLAEAFVVNSIKMRLTVLSYKRIYNPLVPFVIVSNMDSAMEYCEKIKPTNESN